MIFMNKYVNLEIKMFTDFGNWMYIKLFQIIDKIN